MDILYLIWLCLQKNLATVRIGRLIDYFGSAKNVYENDSIYEYISVEGIGKETAETIMQSKNLDEAYRILEFTEKNDVGLVSYWSKSYPKKLRQVYGAPPMLYYKGDNVFTEDTPSVAIVGSRKCTNYGLSHAASIAEELASCGINVVSGLAKGIDAAAHKAVLKAGGITTGVLGCGIDIIYPASNKDLFSHIKNSGGMILTEFSPGTAAVSTNFPQRNRIISGICDGVIVVEAAKGSGSLITANYALEQGRDVYAVPGNINSTQSEGTNELIRQGARLITSGKDVIEDMYDILRCIYPDKQDKNPMRKLDKDEEAVYNAISLGNDTLNSVSQYLNKPVGSVSGVISVLEIEGIISVDMGKLAIL